MSGFKVGLMMSCGCAASATLSIDGAPAVPGCGVHDCITPMTEDPLLAGRVAFCSYGRHGETPSRATLAFFRYHPSWSNDEYYCGCRGWD